MPSLIWHAHCLFKSIRVKCKSLLSFCLCPLTTLGKGHGALKIRGKMKANCSVFRQQIESILKKHNLIESFNLQKEFHAKFQSKSFLPLVVERHGQFVSVTHYFEHNGELIPDPDMELLIGGDGEWYPVAIQFSTGHYARSGYWSGDMELISTREFREQISFSKVWAKNLKEQGY